MKHHAQAGAAKANEHGAESRVEVNELEQCGRSHCASGGGGGRERELGLRRTGYLKEREAGGGGRNAKERKRGRGTGRGSEVFPYRGPRVRCVRGFAGSDAHGIPDRRYGNETQARRIARLGTPLIFLFRPRLPPSAALPPHPLWKRPPPRSRPILVVTQSLLIAFTLCKPFSNPTPLCPWLTRHMSISLPAAQSSSPVCCPAICLTSRHKPPRRSIIIPSPRPSCEQSWAQLRM